MTRGFGTTRIATVVDPAATPPPTARLPRATERQFDASDTTRLMAVATTPTPSA